MPTIGDRSTWQSTRAMMPDPEVRSGVDTGIPFLSGFFGQRGPGGFAPDMAPRALGPLIFRGTDASGYPKPMTYPERFHEGYHTQKPLASEDQTYAAENRRFGKQSPQQDALDAWKAGADQELKLQQAGVPVKERFGPGQNAPAAPPAAPAAPPRMPRLGNGLNQPPSPVGSTQDGQSARPPKAPGAGTGTVTYDDGSDITTTDVLPTGRSVNTLLAPTPTKTPAPVHVDPRFKYNDGRSATQQNVINNDNQAFNDFLQGYRGDPGFSPLRGDNWWEDNWGGGI